MTDLRERVAMAMHAAASEALEGCYPHWGDLIDGDRNMLLLKADAAIAAMGAGVLPRGGADLREKAVAGYDGVSSAMRDEPNAFKRQCFRDGWDAAIRSTLEPAAVSVADAAQWTPDQMIDACDAWLDVQIEASNDRIEAIRNVRERARELRGLASDITDGGV